MKDFLRTFKTNDVDRLFVVAQRLFHKRAFDYFLTAQQLAVLDQIFGAVGHEKLLFARFMMGSLFLKFVQQEKKPAKVDGSLSEKDKETKDEDDDIVEVATIPEGVDSARALALKVRYILWDKAIDMYYDDEDATEYELLELDDDNEFPSHLQSQSQDSTLTESVQPEKLPAVRAMDEDDDYDDDEDDADTAKENNGDQKAEGNPQTAEVKQLEIDDSGSTVLEVPIVPSTDTSQLNNRTLIGNFNKVYHNFENDKDTLIKRRKLDENDKLLDNDLPNSKDLIAMNLGAANLSLKHLLHAIDEYKEKLQLPEHELRQLIRDVRKNRSKWASDEKIGQEELYDACEKVILELRNHDQDLSAPFMSKVAKRDAPNYYQIIKKPMDITTIIRNLKNFQYKSKQEFCDDVMLIWKNCLTYNSDPAHFLRVMAIRLQKKSLQLFPLIPDITVRDRAEVEAEAQLEDPGTPQPQGRTSSKKGKKRTRNGEVREESAEGTPTDTDNISASEIPVPPTTSASLLSNGALAASSVSTPAGNTSIMNDMTELDDEDNGEPNGYLNNNDDNSKDDLETQTWKNFTSKLRSDFCIKRSELFKDGKLNSDSDAILRDPKRMRNFESFLKSYAETKKHIFNSSNKNTDDEPYLIEYDITGGLPALPYHGMSDEEIEQYETKLVEKVLGEGLKPSGFVAQSGGLNSVLNDNIDEMQEIRKVCFKISLIRQMQQQQFVHHSQMRAPEVEKIDDTIDIDPVSRLENHDKMNKELMFHVMKKRVCKIAMTSGFESTEMSAVDSLTQIAGNYMDNLVKTIKQHLETPSANREQKKSNILSLSLLQNGITRPDELYEYVTENVLKQRIKLKDLKGKLQTFLKQLLRPAYEMSERNFNDNSDQFLSGDFSNEIGEDFFGFKELGLDKEFSMIGGALPLHLLQSRFSENNNETESKSVHREQFESAPFVSLKEHEILSQIKLFQPHLRDCLYRTKLQISKQMKTKKEASDYMASEADVSIHDDGDVPKKGKPKLPPTGKITSSKKKITPYTFFIPDHIQQVATSQPLLEDTNTGDQNENDVMVKLEKENSFSSEWTSV